MSKILHVSVHFDDGGMTTIGANQVCIKVVPKYEVIKAKLASFELTAREFTIVRDILNTVKDQSKTSVADLLTVFKQMDHYQNDVEELVRKMNRIEL